LADVEVVRALDLLLGVDPAEPLEECLPFGWKGLAIAVLRRVRTG
jgi:hypothetical protein